MKILFVITGLGVGGAERQVLDMADRLAQRGHLVRIAYLTGPVRLRPTDPGIEVIPLGVAKSIIGFLRGLRNLIKLVNDFRPDVIHSHMVHANLISRVGRLFSRFPCLVCTAHSMNEGGRLRMLGYRITDALADISTNVGCEAVRTFERLHAVPRGRMISVVNGIDISRFSSDVEVKQSLRTEIDIERQQKIILAVGRFYEAKDYPNLLKAFCKVVIQYKNVTLLIAGDGPLLRDMKKLAVELGIESNLKFLGVRHDIPELMRIADIYVLSSAWEGLPLVVGEAMASSKVVVATDCGGVREFLDDCGFLAPPSDSGQLADVLLQALSLSEQDAEQLGIRARQRIVENYSLDAVVDKWLDIYSNPGAALK